MDPEQKTCGYHRYPWIGTSICRGVRICRDIACQPKVWNSIEGGASFIKGSLFRRTNWRGPLLPPVCVVPLSLPEFSDFDIMRFLLQSSCRLPSKFLVLKFAVVWLWCVVSPELRSGLVVLSCFLELLLTIGDRILHDTASFRVNVLGLAQLLANCVLRCPKACNTSETQDLEMIPVKSWQQWY